MLASSVKIRPSTVEGKAEQAYHSVGKQMSAHLLPRWVTLREWTLINAFDNSRSHLRGCLSGKRPPPWSTVAFSPPLTALIIRKLFFWLSPHQLSYASHLFTKETWILKCLCPGAKKHSYKYCICQSQIKGGCVFLSGSKPACPIYADSYEHGWSQLSILLSGTTWNC